MSDLPLFAISFTDDDHVLRLMRDLIMWHEPEARQRTKAFFLPERVDEPVLSSIFEPLRAISSPLAHPVGEGFADARAIVSRRGEVTAPLLAGSPRAALIQRLGERSKSLDIDACKAVGAEVSLLPRYSLEHVADHTMMLILAAARRLHAMRQGLDQPVTQMGEAGRISYNWPAITGIRALSGLTLGVVGMGEIGLRVARRAEAFGMHIVWTSRHPSGADGASGGWAQADLPALLACADIVTLHVPPAGLTDTLIGVSELQRMKPGALLVNTARGALIDEMALTNALRSGHLSGAALDVYAAEPLSPSSPLRTMSNVLLTPHVAGGSRQVVLKEMSDICENLVDTLHGMPPRHGRIVT